MKLKRLILENCIGLIKGSDVDKLEINFDLGDSAIIGIFGKVGSGKSTLLNNMNPYRANFNNDFYEDGYKEIEFEFKDNTYVSKIYQGKASLFKNGKLLNDGKVSTYDEELENEIGDEKVFMKLLYAGKRFKNILNLTKGERKELIVDYLLEYLKKYETYQGILKNDMETLIDEIRVDEIKREEYETLVKEGKEVLQKSFIEKENYEKIEDTLEKLQKEQKLFLEEKERNKELFSSMELLGKDIENNNSKIKEITNSIKEKNESISKLKEKYLKLKESIPKEADIDIEYIKSELKSYKDKYDENENKMSDELSLIHNLKSDINNLENKILDKEKKKKFDLPCSSKLQIKCPFTDFKDIDKLKSEDEQLIKDWNTKLKNQKKEKDELDKKYIKLNTAKLNLKKEISSSEDKIKEYNEYEKKIAQKPLLDEYKEQGKNLKKEIEQLKLNKSELEEKTSKLQKDLDKKIEKYNESEYKDLSNKIEEEKEKLKKSDVELKYLEKLYHDYSNKTEKAWECNHRLEENQKQLAEYDLLVEFFGKTGGQIFDIEQAGEEISDVANKLLEHYEDKKIIVKFDTLKENKKGEIKEVFDIAVSINDGDWQTYLSDGESVLVSNAIREAMCYLRSSKEFKTVFIDELDGSIDTDNIIGFIKLLEEGNKLNERQFTFLISHNEEVKAYLEKSIVLKGDSLIINL